MPQWKDFRRFLKNNGKFLRHGRNHDIYLFKGRKIRVSRSSGEIGRNIWKDILNKQLGITQEEFNAGI